MIFSLVLGFKGKKLKILFTEAGQSFVLHWHAAIHCSINFWFQLLLYFQPRLNEKYFRSTIFGKRLLSLYSRYSKGTLYCNPSHSKE